MERDLTTSAPDDGAPPAGEAHSAVSWGAVIAGAVAALAASFALMAVAAGFGLKLGSPWPGGRSDLADFSPILGSSMIAVQVLSSAPGGYLAGRLRTKWTNVHGHEVHFRDTAHGLLAWAVSTLMGVVLAASVLTPLTERTAVAAAVQSDVAASAAGAVPNAGARPDPAALQRRADRDANIAAQFSLFMGIGLLLGAFTGCVAAAIGGLRRDEMHATFWTEYARAGGAVRP